MVVVFMQLKYFILYLCLILVPQAQGATEITGGQTFVANGAAAGSGTSVLTSSGGDPSITLAITSTASLFLFGPGNITNSPKTGSQNIDISLAGYELAAGFNGEVSSSVILTSQGSASASAFVGATATGLSTGGSSHDIFGSADLVTSGYLNGAGTATASAKGSANYDVKKIGTPSEVWGEITGGESSMSLKGLSSSSMVSTGGTENGLHADSRVTETILGALSDTSTSQMSSYASTVNDSKANVSTSGFIQSGGWDPSFNYVKSKYVNENVRTSAKGGLVGYAESNGNLDAADLSSIIKSTALKDSDLFAEGGPATYTSSSQNSSSTRVYAEAKVENASWGSVAQSAGKIAVEWGDISLLKSGAITDENATNALSFAKFHMNTNCSIGGPITVMAGNLSMDTYTEASHNKTALAGALVLGTGQGTTFSNVGVMLSKAHVEGGMFHYSLVNSTAPGFATTSNILGSGFVSTDPGGKSNIIRPIKVDTTKDPGIAFSGTELSYYQAG